jgi:hypothetical protein
MMTDDVQVTIPGALLILQFCLMIIMFLGVWIRVGERSHERYANTSSLFFTIIVFAIATIGPIFFTGKFGDTWSVIYGAGNFTGTGLETTKNIIFILDIFISSLMIIRTGGWKLSPFLSILFSLPAFAILLRETGGRVAIYTLLIAAFFGCGLWRDRVYRNQPDERYERKEDDVATWVVAISMLILTTVIGVLTRHD